MSDQEQKIEQKSNENITVFFRTRPGCIVKMEVHVAPLAVRAAHTKAVKELKKEISLPGFRKGKIPDEIVLKNFAHVLEDHFKEVLINTAFSDAASLIERRPFSSRSVRKAEIKHQGKDGAYVLVYEYEAAPKIPRVDFTTFSRKQLNIPEVTSEDEEALLARLKLVHSERRAVEGRPAQEGDFAQVDVVPCGGDQDGDVYERGVHLKYPSDEKEMVDAILGMQIGEKKQVQEGGEEYTVTLCSLGKTQDPEENEEFFAKVGASSFADLREKLRATEKKQRFAAVLKEIRTEFKNELIERYAFDLPQSLIDAETSARFGAYLKTEDVSDDDKERVRKEFQEEVKRFFTCLFLMEEVARRLNIPLTQQEFMMEMMEQMYLVPPQEKVFYTDLPREDIQHRVLMNLLIKKCCDVCILGNIEDQQMLPDILE